MKYKVLTGFSGLVSGAKDDIIEINDTVIAKDLLKAGYIESVKESIKKIATKKSKSTEV